MSKVELSREEALSILEMVGRAVKVSEPQHLTEEMTAIREPLEVSAPRFKFGSVSTHRLRSLHKPLRDCAELAIELSRVDFAVYETLRTQRRQRELVLAKMSRTMNSKHLPDKSGYARAVDLVPVIDGKLKWDWDGCYEIACAMDAAATQLGHAAQVRWGGAWDRVLADFGGDMSQYRAEVEAYKIRHAGSDFIDGPHFEWVE
jgi:peptidoglycan L-alanyl-D-glutamate endopeptidase CwlK